MRFPTSTRERLCWLHEPFGCYNRIIPLTVCVSHRPAGIPPMLPHQLLHRREFLQVGASSLLGLGLPALLAGRAASASRQAERAVRGRSFWYCSPAA